jgi:eukaryotic-like serine/threonine-protein kinase
MTLSTISSLSSALEGRYTIERELGAGGMATVYLAHDIRHGRDVAIKVLHPELGAALGGDRFLSEIKTTARLQHPHILPLLDSGESEGLLYYVMPLVTGETLRAKLSRERQLSIEDAMLIAREVADALAYAHGLGIIHRDIKPENILLQNGHALVADFGIALAVQSAGGQRMTQTGLSLGTPQYMSPEQAMGERTIDARSDVYALGAVTYEMLTGEPPFTGATVQAIVARVLSSEPARPTEVRKSVPAPVEAAVLRALAKLPADRFGSASDFIAAFSQPVAPTPGSSRARAATRATYALAALAAVASAIAIWALQRPGSGGGTGSPGPSYETAIVLPVGAPLAFIGAGPLGVGMQAFAVSPDGSTLVYVGQDGVTTRLYRRALDASAVEALPGTEGAYAPFFAPDGKSVGFFASGALRRAAIDGSATVTLAEMVLPYGATWLSDGRIIVAANEGDRLVSVPSGGGSPVPVGFGSSSAPLVFPEPLPGERALLLTTMDHRLAVVPLAGGPVLLLGPGGAVQADSVTPETELFSGSHPKYIASGHILYHSLDGAVMALPFDPVAHRVLGAPVAVRAGVRLESVWGAGQLVVTRDGTLIYAPGENGRLTWLVRRGAAGQVDTLQTFGRADYGAVDLAADGSRLLVSVCPVQGRCGRQVLNLREGVRLALASDEGSGSGSSGAGWNGSQRIYISDRGRSRRERRGAPFTISFSPENATARDSAPGVVVFDVASDGAVLFGSGDSLFTADSWAALSDGASRAGFVLPESDAWGHQLRPGGDWVAYTSMNQQAGDYVVFVARTRPPFERWRASPRGGEEPVWDRRGNLVYREGNRWMRVTPPATVGDKPGVATFLFSGNYLNVLGRSHDIAPDGSHLLIAGPAETTTATLTVVTRWVDRLPARAR